jgi:hypothetical protein
MAKQVQAWKSEDGTMFDDEKKALCYDAEQTLRQRLMMLLGASSEEVDGIVLDCLVKNARFIQRYLEEFFDKLSKIHIS